MFRKLLASPLCWALLCGLLLSYRHLLQLPLMAEVAFGQNNFPLWPMLSEWLKQLLPAIGVSVLFWWLARRSLARVTPAIMLALIYALLVIAFALSRYLRMPLSADALAAGGDFFSWLSRFMLHSLPLQAAIIVLCWYLLQRLRAL